MSNNFLVAPFPWFGGKRQVAGIVWNAFGKVANYVEPFFGSGAVLWGRPLPFDGVETINDKDGFVSNFWRALQANPSEVAKYVDWPQNENDLHARHTWLLTEKNTLVARLEGDPEFFDAKIAGWWVWGICLWIGSGFCSGTGPWAVDENRQLIHLGDAGQGINRQLIHLGNAGQGINRQRIHLGNAGQGINRKRIHLGDAGQGINRKRIHLGDAGQGINRQRIHLGNAGQGETESESILEMPVQQWFQVLSKRIVRVRVCSGDWGRVSGPSVTFKHGMTGVFLDPPYADSAQRQSNLYRVDSEKVAHDVCEWAIANGENPLMRIALCGYDGEHRMPATWKEFAWKAKGGYEGQGEETTGNCKKERIWFSPHCLPPVDKPQTLPIFGEGDLIG